MVKRSNVELESKKERRMRKKKYLKRIMAKCFPKHEKPQLQIQETLNPQSWIIQKENHIENFHFQSGIWLSLTAWSG